MKRNAQSASLRIFAKTVSEKVNKITDGLIVIISLLITTRPLWGTAMLMTQRLHLYPGIG
jgi:hypothetical protein